MNLYKISQSIIELASLLADDNLPDDLREKCELLKKEMLTEIEKKVIGMHHFLLQLKSEEEMINDEIKRLQELKRSNLNKHKRLKDFLVYVMKETGREVDTPTLKIKLRKVADSIVINNEIDIPSKFMVQPEPPAPKPDKRALMASYKKTGVVPSGCSIETDKYTLTVK